jgi:hypothetical protein
MFLNVCFGEMIEINLWLSNTIVPFCLILLFLNITLYFSADYLAKSFIKILNILIIIMLVLFLVVGLYAIIQIISTNYQNITDLWMLLSPLSRVDYYKNDVNYLSYIYYWKMIITGILYLSLAATGALSMVFSYQLFFAINDQWRPPLRSKLTDETALRYIDFNKRFNKDYKVLDELKDDMVPLNQGGDNQQQLLLNNNKENNANNANNIQPGIVRENDIDHNKDLNRIEDNNNNNVVINEPQNNIENNVRDNYGSNIPLTENLNNDVNEGDINENNDPQIDDDNNNNEDGPKRRKIRRLKR